jgi:predicted neuraminidase
MKTQIVVATAAGIGEQWLGIPGVEVTSGGRLYVTWFSGGDKEPHPDNQVWLCASDDGGRAFTPPARMTWPADNHRTYDPTLWLDPRGVLWLIYNQGNNVTGVHGIYARCCANPDAASPEWSKPRRLGYDVPFCARMNKPTVLTTGEWLMPVTWSRQDPHTWWTGENLQGVGISTDQGESWELCGAVEAPAWALENMIVERRDGSLAMYIRTGAGAIWMSDSADRGRTWSAGYSSGIPNPGSRFYLRALSSGCWLLLNNAEPDARTGITAQLSDDEGRAWSAPLLLDDRAQLSYPDAALAADGTIFAVHDRERHGAAEVILSIFREGDVITAP